MKRHETPNEVAVALARHAPKSIRALLDPAVGTGNLIRPILARVKSSRSEVVCIDIDPEAIQYVSESYRSELGASAKFINADFLKWQAPDGFEGFDCIVMNPPFAAKKSCWQLMEINRDDGRTIARPTPLEAAFVRKSIDLLREGGRLLSILPCSVVMADSLQWLRDNMISEGAIRFVHELPPRTFTNVESRMYLLVFEKGASRRTIALLNHDLHKPERITLQLKDGRPERLDFGYVSARAKLSSLQKRRNLQWTPLGNVADVIRGEIDSPLGPRCAIHSTDFSAGFWHASERHDQTIGEKSERRIRRGDLLMSRVGRAASRSVGRGIGISGMACSDCVMIIRPKNYRTSLKTLFALRFVLCHEWIQPLVERGTGATYVSHLNLLDLRIPDDLWKCYPAQFRKFVAAERAYNSESASEAVRAVSLKIKQ